MSRLDLPVFVQSTGLEPRPGLDTFLLIHGYGASSFTWRHWVPRLAARGHVVLMDMKGFGSAPKPTDGRYAPSDQAELTRRVIERRDLRNLTLVGHSLGGGVALLTALAFLDRGDPRLRRLVLVASAAYDQRLPPFVRLASYPRLSALLFRAAGPTLLAKLVLRSVVHDASAIDSDFVRGYAEPLGSKAALPALIAAARQVRPEGLDDLTRRYREIQIPTLLLWGRRDRVVPLWVAQRLARELPNASLHVLEACGHLPAEERPRESYDVLAAFLDGRSESTPH